MKFRASVLDEPLLEFGGGGQEIDIRLGLMRHGPLEPERAPRVRLGVIGTSDTIEGFDRFLQRCQVGIDAKPSRQPNLFLPFPGLATENPFRCAFEIEPRARKPIPRSDVTRIARIKSRVEAINEAVGLFVAQAQAIAESPGPPDVIICALPFELITSVMQDTGLDRSEEAVDDQAGDTGAAPDFRDLLKARTIHLKRPLQLIWPTTWEDSGRSIRQLAKLANKPVQDPATRAWNLFGGLYYKAGNIPWRLPRDPAQFDTSYVGVSFYRDLSGQRLLTSTAQMFDERGQGLILRGGQARTDKHDRRPYLSRTDAYDLLKRSLAAYVAHHFHAPARVIIYKTSPFRAEETEGFEEALAEAHVRLSDLVWVSEDSEFRLYRDGAYPPLRGTCLELESNALLYCRGSVPYYRTYPGLYIPKPLLLRPCPGGESTLSELAKETLALSKMNWNSTQFDGSSPITLRASRVVGRVLKHVSLGAMEAAEYRHYI